MRLRRYLLLQTATWAIVIMLSGAILILAQGHRMARRDALDLARTIERVLEVQIVGFVTEGGGHAGFPDWPVVSRVLADKRGCVRLRRPDNSLWRSECRLREGEIREVPAMFAALYRSFFRPGEAVARPIDDAGGVVATLVVEPSATAEIVQAWRASQRLGGLIAVTAVLLALIVSGLTARALRTTTSILDGLARLERGDLGVRLDPGRFEEIARLAQAINALTESLRASERSRNKLANRVLSVQEEERLHLARELHDEFGQHLTAIASMAAAIRYGESARDPEAAIAAGRIEFIVREMHRQLREVLATLRPPGLDEVGLAASLNTLVQQWNHQLYGELTVALAIEGDLDTLTAPLKVHLYRIVQESLTNVVRHAGASATQIQLTRRPRNSTDRILSAEVVELRISDNGRVFSEAESSAGFGRRGIEERVAALQGLIDFHTGEPTGIRLLAVLPVAGDDNPA